MINATITTGITRKIFLLKISPQFSTDKYVILNSQNLN